MSDKDRKFILFLLCIASVALLIIPFEALAVDFNLPAYTYENPYSGIGNGHECTWYCWGRAKEKGVTLSTDTWRNARYWAEDAAPFFQVGDEPKANSIFVENWYL